MFQYTPSRAYTGSTSIPFWLSNRESSLTGCDKPHPFKALCIDLVLAQGSASMASKLRPPIRNSTRGLRWNQYRTIHPPCLMGEIHKTKKEARCELPLNLPAGFHDARDQAFISHLTKAKTGKFKFLKHTT